MAMSEKFEAMSYYQKRTFIEKVKRLYDAGISAESISEGLHKDLDLVQEAIDMIGHAKGLDEELGNV